MTEDIFINASLGEVRVALVQDGRLLELQIERENQQNILGSVFLGRVERVVSGVNAAFVEIGMARAGFLGAWEALTSAERAEVGMSSPPPIAESVAEGETILVQAIKEPVADKGARLSRQLSFAGRHLVYAPQDEGIKISRRIEDEAVRERLKSEVEAAQKEIGAPGGFIVRTAAAEVTHDELLAEITGLSELWGRIESSRQEASPPDCLYSDLGPVERALRDLVGDQTSRILIDSGAAVEAARNYCAIHLPDVVDRIEHFSEAAELFDSFGLEDQIDGAIATKVDLPSGGRIVIESTEALTAIDINSARTGASGGPGSTALSTNLEAVTEAARQLRLRNIGGLVVIDLIHMDESDSDKVLEALQQAVVSDRAPISIGEISPFGLIEMTRKRTRDSLRTQLGEDCATCEGEGWRLSVDTVAHEILRAAEHEARAGVPAGPGKPVLDIYAAPVVANHLLEKANNLLAQLERNVGIAVEIHIDREMDRDAYDIEVQSHE